MSDRILMRCVALCVVFGLGHGARAAETDDFRLVPYPKQVARAEGTFDLQRPLVLQMPAGMGALEARLIADEWKRAGLPAPKSAIRDGTAPTIRLAVEPLPEVAEVTFRADATPEDYQLVVQPASITCVGKGPPGLFYAVQTLCQLIRANRKGTALPCLEIEDWPSLRWRCFQDDLTRGPSSTLATLERGIQLGASLKLNLFTYYMEYQYGFAKHPEIGPPDGSLTPDELKALVDHGVPYQVQILGNQQSFGHFGRILKHEQYADLRENNSVLSPVREGTYQLLDDLYSEVCPLLPFEMFNVCCDETWGLGEGPSKQLAAEIGTGGVYVQHIRRVHDLLRSKYGKRMMMWGDIILQHPDKLEQIPKDTVMLTWGYGARESFEDQIIPFKNSGYEFFVCPGISNWSRILPDFGVATTNIQNFVRDGAKHGAIGMLNTDWEDDGEALQGYRWHGHPWGAECAWNASTTSPEDFNRRIGGVLFGESGDHFGHAIELLAQTHRQPGMQGMVNRRFWENDFVPSRSPATIEASSRRLLEVTRPAIEHLEACRREAIANADLLDAFLHGARRMELIGTRMRDGLRAAQCYAQACDAAPRESSAMLDEVERLVRENRDAHAALGREFERLWRADCKPYALDWTMDRYAATTAWYDGVLERLAEARRAAQADEPLPSPEAIGLPLPERFTRRSRPHKIETTPLDADRPWDVPEATHRFGLVVRAGNVPRGDVPIELDVAVPAKVVPGPVRAFRLRDSEAAEEVLAQLDPSPQPGKTQLTLLIPGPLDRGSEARIQVYLGMSCPPAPLPTAVHTREGDDGMQWIENDQVRWLLGPEGAHVYRWEVKSVNERDLTQPGTRDWSGFADAGHGHRNLPHELACIKHGPALVQYRCTDETGLEKTINFFGGAGWIEVLLSEPVTYYWDFDNPDNFSADGSTPGQYLFSNGQNGAVGKQADGVKAQVKAAGARWAVKFHPDGLALGLIAPETSGSFVIAPGAGAGGVGIENSPPISHFVTYGGRLVGEPQLLMERLRQTLDFSRQVEVVLYATEER